MWCIGNITPQYRQRIYNLLDLYHRPYNSDEPVVCVDEKSKQLLAPIRSNLPGKPGQVTKVDYEYERKGTRNLFVAVEPLAGWRQVEVTLQRKKADFVNFIRQLLQGRYRKAKRVHLVLDNLNTHFAKVFVEDKQCLNERIATEEKLVSEVVAWQKRRNQQHKTINWSFTRHDADKKLGKHYVA